MKRRLFDNIMFVFSIIYLAGTIVLILLKKIELDIVSFFGTDGLTLLGCVFALGELVLSRRNAISKRVNQMLVYNKIIQYRVGLVIDLPEKNVVSILMDLFEGGVKETLQLNEVRRKVIAEIVDESCKVHYEDVGCTIEFYKSEGYINCRIVGKTKFGKLYSRKKDILYFAGLIELLSDKFLQEDFIRKKANIKKVEIVIRKQGSQLKCKNVFNQEMGDVDTYCVTMIDEAKKDTQITINDEEIILTTTKISSLVNEFVDLTNVICSIE